MLVYASITSNPGFTVTQSHTFISQTFCSNLSFDTVTVGYTVVVHVMDRLDNINNYIITVVQYQEPMKKVLGRSAKHPRF